MHRRKPLRTFISRRHKIGPSFVEPDHEQCLLNFHQKLTSRSQRFQEYQGSSASMRLLLHNRRGYYFTGQSLWNRRMMKICGPCWSKPHVIAESVIDMKGASASVFMSRMDSTSSPFAQALPVLIKAPVWVATASHRHVQLISFCLARDAPAAH